MKLHEASLSLGSLNIEQYCHLDRVIPALCEADCDVICLQEVPEDVVGRLADIFHASAFYVPMMKRVTRGREGERSIGLALLVRRGLVDGYDDVVYHEASQEDIPYPVSRIFQYVSVVKDEVRFNIGHTHFTWTPDGAPSATQYSDLAALFAAIAKVTNNDLVLCGDFNASRDEHIWKNIAGRFRDNVPSSVITTLDQKHHRAAPIFLVVDGMFSSKHYAVTDVELTNGVSDHLLVAGRVVRVSS